MQSSADAEPGTASAAAIGAEAAASTPTPRRRSRLTQVDLSRLGPSKSSQVDLGEHRRRIKPPPPTKTQVDLNFFLNKAAAVVFVNRKRYRFK
jgi:hypothetical protein